MLVYWRLLAFISGAILALVAPNSWRSAKSLFHRLDSRLGDMGAGVLVLLDALRLRARLPCSLGELVHLLMVVIVGRPQCLVSVILGVRIAFEPARP